jgi:hypothetical protein
MHSAVVFHVMSQLERLAAKFTFKGTIACVDREVRYQ